MRRARAALALLLLAAASPAAARDRAARGAIVLDGEPVAVRWTDGDSLRVESGRRRGERGRLSGVNALETFGPVHRWGGWAPRDLLALARSTAARAASARWRCRSAGRDGYRRTLLECPDAARALVEAGLAMVLAVEGAPDPALVAAQRRAQAAGAGMWRLGIPSRIPTSVHSAGEPGLAAAPYDRVADTRTGLARAAPHGRRRAACEEVCVGLGPDRACLVYVPFERRYRRRPACLR